MPDMITATDVSHSYGSGCALDGVSLSFPSNRACGLLGLNGAGKSTLLKILTGIIAPGSGRVEIDGVDICRDRSPLARVGYLPEIPPLNPDLTVGEQLAHAAALKKLSAVADETKKAMEAVDIGSVSRRLIGNLSKGYRQRVGIAQALLGDPAAVILDEPTVGLDPGQLAAVRRLLTELARERTVIFSSHILSEVRAVCDDVSILAKGRVRATGALADLMRKEEGLFVTVDCRREEIARDAFLLEGVSRIEMPDSEDGAGDGIGTIRVRLTCPDSRAMRRLVFDRAVERGLTVLELRSADAGLEEIFAALSGTTDGTA